MKANVPFLAYRCVAIALVGGATAAAWHVTRQINYGDLLVTIVGVGGVVVTVFGIWLAVIFPRFVASLGNGVPLAETADAQRYNVLMRSLYRSAFVLISALGLLVVSTFFPADTPEFRSALCAYSMLSLLALAESLFSSIANGELAATEAINHGVVVGVVRRRRRQRTQNS